MSSMSRCSKRSSWAIGFTFLFGFGVAAADDSAAVQELLDTAAIQNVLARYTHALDALDANEFASLFTMNAVFDAGDNVVRRGRVQIHGIIVDMIANNAAAPAAGLEVAAAMHHVLTNSLIEFSSSDEARHYGYWMTVLGNADNQYGMVAMGHYEDVLVKRRGRWLIRSRKLLR